jgi:hypothetical protein
MPATLDPRSGSEQLRRPLLRLEPARLRLARVAPATASARSLPPTPATCADPAAPLLIEAIRQRRHAAAVPGREHYERLVAARCAGLRDLLRGWDPTAITSSNNLLTSSVASSSARFQRRRRHPAKPGPRFKTMRNGPLPST